MKMVLAIYGNPFSKRIQWQHTQWRLLLLASTNKKVNV